MNTQAPLLDRRRDAARKLAVSESQILKWEREGLLHPIKVPGLRAIRYAASEVEDLARRWIASSLAATNGVQGFNVCGGNENGSATDGARTAPVAV